MDQHEPAATAATAHQPLAGIRVVDVSRYLPGPFCTLNLAWLGADVTAVEQPPHGDPLRSLPPVGPDGVSLSYRSLRRMATIELLELGPDAPGQARMLELCDEADVLVESFRPGVVARLGIGPEQLRARNPRLVYCSISGYGQTGPWAQAPGHDINYEAVAGLLEQSGTPDEVTLPPVPMADLAGGMQAATAICAALLQRERTGLGATIDMSLTEAALSLQAMQLPNAALEADCARGGSMLTGGLASYGPYRCADGRWIAIGPIEPTFFARLCELIERDELVGMQYDVAAQDQLREQLEQVFAAKDACAWEALLAGDDGGQSCVTRTLHPRELHAHPQLAARHAVVDLPGAVPGVRMPASPFVMDGVRSDVPTT